MKDSGVLSGSSRGNAPASRAQPIGRAGYVSASLHIIPDSAGLIAAMTTDHVRPRSGVARNYYYYPGDGFGFGYGFGVRTDSGHAVAPSPGSRGEINWDGATGCYIVVDRAQDMFFVLMQNSPSGRRHVQFTLKKIIYGAFGK
jgi:CubicO group peptidase (beta-lactamase class C family)